MESSWFITMYVNLFEKGLKSKWLQLQLQILIQLKIAISTDLQLRGANHSDLRQDVKNTSDANDQ
jgi:hypothetical protein